MFPKEECRPRPVTLEMLNANLDRPVAGKPVQLPYPRPPHTGSDETA